MFVMHSILIQTFKLLFNRRIVLTNVATQLCSALDKYYFHPIINLSAGMNFTRNRRRWLLLYLQRVSNLQVFQLTLVNKLYVVIVDYFFNIYSVNSIICTLPYTFVQFFFFFYLLIFSLAVPS